MLNKKAILKLITKCTNIQGFTIAPTEKKPYTEMIVSLNTMAFKVSEKDSEVLLKLMAVGAINRELVFANNVPDLEKLFRISDKATETIRTPVYLNTSQLYNAFIVDTHAKFYPINLIDCFEDVEYQTEPQEVSVLYVEGKDGLEGVVCGMRLHESECKSLRDVGQLCKASLTN